MVATLLENLAEFEKLRDKLETEHFDRWVVFHDLKLIGTYDSFENAVNEAVGLFGRGPYLIRQVDAPP